jgi:hypothetical protein
LVDPPRKGFERGGSRQKEGGREVVGLSFDRPAAGLLLGVHDEMPKFMGGVEA